MSLWFTRINKELTQTRIFYKKKCLCSHLCARKSAKQSYHGFFPVREPVANIYDRITQLFSWWGLRWEMSILRNRLNLGHTWPDFFRQRLSILYQTMKTLRRNLYSKLYAKIPLALFHMYTAFETTNTTSYTRYQLPTGSKFRTA